MSNEQSNMKMNMDEVTPESLMEHFQGPGIVKMVLVTVIFHAVVVLGTSVSYLKASLVGEDVSKLTKEERVEKALADATSALRKIATANGLNPQDISDKMGTGAVRAPKKETPPAGGQAASGTNTTPVTTTPVATGTETGTAAAVSNEAPAKPESQIEKDLKKAVDGPKVPPVGTTDDIFQ
jgi:hypothetical protein